MSTPIRIVLLVIAFLALLIPSEFAPLTRPSAEQKSKLEKTIWAGRSGVFKLRWTTSDITASSSSNQADVRFSAKDLATRGFQEFAALLEEGANCFSDRTFTVLSVVGSIVSFRDNSSGMCVPSAHPFGETRFTSIDLARPDGVAYKELTMNVDLTNPGKIVRLSDLFPEEDILNAMLADPLVKRALAEDKIVAPPKTLAQFVNTFTRAGLSNKECYSVSVDLLTRFAFHHLENDRVAVRLGLSGTSLCRENLTQIGILLPIPPSLKTALKLAESGKEGFLMKDLQKISGNQTTMLSFTSRKGGSR